MWNAFWDTGPNKTRGVRPLCEEQSEKGLKCKERFLPSPEVTQCLMCASLTPDGPVQTAGLMLNLQSPCVAGKICSDYSQLMKQEAPLLITPSTCLICTDENSCPPPSFCSDLHPTAEDYRVKGDWMSRFAGDSFVSQSQPQLAPYVCLKLLDEENKLKIKPAPVICS